MADVHGVLRRVPLLKHLPRELQDRVIAAGRERSVARTEVLFTEGAPAEVVLALLAGRVKLVRYSPGGRELLLHLVEPGQTFAEAAVFGDGTYPATAVAVEPSVVWCWSRESILALLREEPELALGMMQSVSLWARHLATKLELLTQRRVEERLAVFLLARAGDRVLEAGEAVEIPEARNLVAAQCGTAPEVLSRTLRRMEEAGTIRADGHRIVILEPDRLHRLAGGAVE